MRFIRRQLKSVGKATVLLVAGALAGCGADTPDFDDPELKCNGLVELCDRPLDQVVFARSHNSHASQEAGYDVVNWNHYFGVPRQLADGIRSLNFDVYHENGETLLCHGLCVFASQLAVEGLAEIMAFLEDHRNEVVLLDLQNETTLEHTLAAFDESGLPGYAHTQLPGEPWPTLREMIRADRRLVVFSDREDAAPGWYHATDDFVYGNDWAFEAPEDLNCTLTGAPIPHGLLEITHVLTNPLASPDNAELINHNPFLRDRIDGCISELGRLPTMISVDFYSIGDVLQVVHDLNLAQ